MPKSKYIDIARKRADGSYATLVWAEGMYLLTVKWGGKKEKLQGYIPEKDGRAAVLWLQNMDFVY